jgi:hypothetical protein
MGHGVLVVRNENSGLLGGYTQNFRIENAVQLGIMGALKIDGGLSPQDASANRTAEVVVGLEAGLH